MFDLVAVRGLTIRISGAAATGTAVSGAAATGTAVSGSAATGTAVSGAAVHVARVGCGRRSTTA